MEVIRFRRAPISVASVGLVADGRGHTAQQRETSETSLGEAEDIVDEEQHVLVF